MVSCLKLLRLFSFVFCDHVLPMECSVPDDQPVRQVNGSRDRNRQQIDTPLETGS